MPFADINATRIHYRLDGAEDRPVIMLSNSLASDLSMWDPQVPALLEAGNRVLRYDSRGHGQSSVPEGPYSMEMLCRDALGLLDWLGLDRVDFCGLSKGGMVGQMLGRHYPERLESLLLSSTAARMGPRDVWDERIAIVREQGMQAVAEGEHDPGTTVAHAEEIQTRIPKARLQIIPEAAHLVNMEQSGAFNRMLLNFLGPAEA